MLVYVSCPCEFRTIEVYTVAHNPNPTIDCHVSNPMKVLIAMEGAKRQTPMKIVICRIKMNDANCLTNRESNLYSKYCKEQNTPFETFIKFMSLAY